MRTSVVLPLALVAAAVPAAADETLDLAPPVRVMAGDEPIDVDAGHATPCVGDVDGDGRPDLLVGQFGEGKLRLYRNVGTRTQPRFDPDFAWVKGGRDPAHVHSG